MKFGFVKVAAATPSIKVADCEHNANEIIKQIKEADKKGASLVVFPELCVSGYTCGDLFYYDVLLKGCEQAIERIIKETEDLEIVSVVGVPVEYNNNIYNCAAVICKGELLGLVPKHNVSGSDCFSSGKDVSCLIEYADAEEPVMFCSTVFKCESIENFNIGIEIGEDLYSVNPPSVELALNGEATVIANLSCSAYTVGKSEYRRKFLEILSGKLNCGYACADSGLGESTTDCVFSAENMILENGSVLAEGSAFENGIIYGEIDLQRVIFERRKNGIFKVDGDYELGYDVYSFDIEDKEVKLDRKLPQLPFLPENSADIPKRCAEILKIQSVGLATRLKNIGCKNVVLGISGGLDSTLALIVCVHTFDMLGIDRKNIHTVTMPCFGTTKRTKSNAEKICEAYGVSFQEVNITASVTQHFTDISHDIDNHNVTFENSQARERTQVLMDLANEYGALVVGTGDLSELALGWATYNGDHMSMYGVNASVPKTLVRYLVNYEAENSKGELKEGLLDILATPVSPELLPPKENGEIAQVTEDVVGPYELHDFFLYYMLRFGYSPSKIFYLAKQTFEDKYDADTIKKWLTTFTRRFFNQQFKRNCLPDGPKVGSVSLSPRGDWKMPSDASSVLWLKELENL